MTVLFAVILTVLFFLDALRLRERLSHLKVCSATPAPDSVSTDYVIYSVAGVSISDLAKAQLIAYTQDKGLMVLDAAPQRCHSLGWLSLAQIADFGHFRTARLAKGNTAGHCMVIHQDVLNRMPDPSERTELSLAEFVQLAKTAKLYAPVAFDFVLCDAFQSTGYQFEDRRIALEAQMDKGWWFVPVAQVVVISLLVWFTLSSPVAGLVATLAFLAQVPMICWQPHLKTGDLLPATIMRPVLELAYAAAACFGRSPNKPIPVDQKPLRQTYAKLVANGLHPFYEEARTTCPICQSRHLQVRLSTTDIIQRKPGRFQLHECADCGHIFQNPRLSIEGLNYYYKDFYDGLGEEGLAAVFGYSPDPYLNRAKMLKGLIEPDNWLDVGAGHGHFCCVARDVWPDTRFDALDLSVSVEEAARRGWADQGILALFPDKAKELEGQYDVVSMSHYLEHTREPKDEIQAAATVLREGGAVMIEVPDPDCRLGHLLGRYWVPWFQPQHQHLLSSKNLEKVLKENGFEIREWHFGQAHQPVDFFFAAYLQLNSIAPPVGYPWCSEPTVFQRVLHRTIWSVGTLYLALGWCLDRTLAPAVRQWRHSNTMRVVAQKTKTSA